MAKDYDSAIVHARAAVEARRSEPIAWKALGAAQYGARRFDDAITSYTLATSLAGPQDRSAIINELSTVYYMKGKSLLAKLTYDATTKKFITVPGTLEAFSQALALTPDGAQARDILDTLVSLGAPTPPASPVTSNAAGYSRSALAGGHCTWSEDFSFIRDPGMLDSLRRQDFAATLQQGGLPINQQIASGEATLAQITATLPTIEATIRGISQPTVTHYNFQFDYSRVCQQNNSNKNALLAAECQHVNVENRGPDLGPRPGRGGRHRTPDPRRGLDRVRSRRIAGLRRRRPAGGLTPCRPRRGRPNRAHCRHDLRRDHDHPRHTPPPLRHLLPLRRPDPAAVRLRRRAPRPRRRHLDGQEPRGPRHLGRDPHQHPDRPGRGQTGVLGRRQHPRRRTHRQHRGPVLPPPARHRPRPRRRGDAAARHPHRLPVPAPQPRRCRTGARRPAPPHPLQHPSLSVRRGPCRRPDGGRRRRRRPRALHAHPRPARRLQEMRRRPAPDGAAQPRRIRRRVLPRDARGHAGELRRPDHPGQQGPRGPGPEPQLPGLLAPGIRAVRRGPVPDQRARGQGHGRLRAGASEHRRGHQLSHPQRGDPAPDGDHERRRHDPRGPVVDQALQRPRHRAHRLPGGQHLARVQVPPEGDDRRHPGLALRAPGRAVLGGRTVGTEQGRGHQGLQVGRLVPRASGRGRPQAAEMERRGMRRPGARRVAPVHAPAARPDRARRLGQDEFLAQPAAAPARARGRALPGLDEPDRAQPAAPRTPAHRSAGRSAPTPGASGSRSAMPAGCRPTSASARWRARRCVA